MARKRKAVLEAMTEALAKFSRAAEEMPAVEIPRPPPYDPYALGLHQEQVDALRCILFGRRNVFLTGVAGTGKTFILRVLCALAERMFPPPITAPHRRSVQVTATTGMAAANLGIEGAGTVHMKLGLRICEDPADVCWGRLDADEKAEIRDARFFVLDEASALSGDALGLVLQVLDLSRTKAVIILTGDLLQLGAVGKGKQRPVPLLGSYAWNRLQLLELLLRTNHRQADDAEYRAFLDEMRVGGYIRNGARRPDPVPAELRALPGFSDSLPYSNAALAMFKTLADTPLPEEGPDAPLWMVPTNARVEAINAARMAACEGPVHVFNSKSETIQKHGRLAEVGRALLKELGMPASVTLKKNCLVMSPVNDARTGLVNGDRGCVTEVNHRSVTIQFRGKPEPLVMKPFKRILFHHGRPVAHWTGLPLVVAHAVTHHKGQGQTTSAVVEADVSWEAAQLYVALSRAPKRSLVRYSGPLPLRRLEVNDVHVRYYERLQAGPTVQEIAAGMNLPALPVFQ